MPNIHAISFLTFSCLVLAACGGGGGGGGDDNPPPPPQASTYSIGGAVTGLAANTTLVLHNNGGDALTVSSSGAFTFATLAASGSAFNVTIAAQPANTTCSTSYGSGTVGSAAVTNVAVACVAAPGQVDPNGTTVLSQTHKPTLVGIVIASVVGNLHYDGAGSLDDTTTAQGEFNYQPGELITFSVGDIELPPVTGRPVISVFNLAGTNDLNNTTLVNIARFLQSLDSDGNPDNGVSISDQAHTAATGQTLDFSSPSFDSQAAPILAATGRSLIDGSTAIARIQAALDNTPKLAPIAGAWTTGSDTNLRAVILLENGLYYGIEGNCAGKPGYEHGTWAYSTDTLTIAVSDDANGSCGLDTGAHPATLSGNALTLDGATWADVSYDTTGLSGLYAFKGFIAWNVLEGSLTLLTNMQYIALDECNGQLGVELGTYSWTGAPSNIATFTMTGESITGCGGSDSALTILRTPSFLVSDDGGTLVMDVAVRPARIPTTLPGVWYLDDSGDLTSNELAYPLIFTSGGRVMYQGNDPACPGLVRSAAGEIGNYAWDALTGAFNFAMTGDSNGDCGLAADAADITSATVTGNLLTFHGDDVTGGSVVKPSSTTFFDPSLNSAVGIWKQTAGSGTLTLLIFQEGTSTLTIRALDSDCPAIGADYAVESLIATVSTPNNIVHTAASNNYDTAACGLPTLLGPTYSVVGDVLTIDGLGTFTRE